MAWCGDVMLSDAASCSGPVIDHEIHTSKSITEMHVTHEQMYRDDVYTDGLMFICVFCADVTLVCCVSGVW